MKHIIQHFLSYFKKLYPVHIISGRIWSLYSDAIYLSNILNIAEIDNVLCNYDDTYSICFFTARWEAIDLMDNNPVNKSKICFPYYHGYPYQNVEHFDTCFAGCLRHKDTIARVQVTHDAMKNYLLEAGFPENKLQKIYIPVDTDIFIPRAANLRRQMREQLNVPQSAFVVGSFQKDGNGWEEGLTPKHIKGPDLLLATLALVKPHVPELFVVLSGPARGYVKRGLERLGIPYVHVYCEQPEEVAKLFPLLDAYCIASRQEGGPKGLLEAMASGVPVVTTHVGQAAELGVDGENALVGSLAVDAVPPHEFGQRIPEACEELSAKLCLLAHDTALRDKLVANGLVTARNNDYRTQAKQWLSFCRNAAACW